MRFSLRFSIRTLLIAITALGCSLGAIAYATKGWRQREQARRELMDCGAIYVGFHDTDDLPAWATTNDPDWVTLRGHLRNDDLANYPTIETVDYARSKVSAADLDVIAKLPCLRLLDLAWCELPPNTGSSLSKLQNVQILMLGGTKFGDADLLMLQSLSTLRAVDVDGSRVTEQGLEAFRAVRPEVTVRH